MAALQKKKPEMSVKKIRYILGSQLRRVPGELAAWRDFYIYKAVSGEGLDTGSEQTSTGELEQ